MNNANLKTMYTDAELFSMDRDTRIALLQYEWSVSWDKYVEKVRKERAVSKGISEGLALNNPELMTPPVRSLETDIPEAGNRSMVYGISNMSSKAC